MPYTEDETVLKYLNRVSVNTQMGARYTLREFFTWLEESGGAFSGYTPRDLVKCQKENTGSFEVVRAGGFNNWV